MLHHVWPVFKIKIEFKFLISSNFNSNLGCYKESFRCPFKSLGFEGHMWQSMAANNFVSSLFHYSGINNTNFLLLGLGNRKANLVKFHTPRPCTYM